MTTYQVINDNEIDLDSPITESLMTRLRNNPLAIQEGDPTAPKIQKDALDSGVVSQPKLDTSIGNVSFTVPTANTASAQNILRASSSLLPGGEYGFSPLIGGTFSASAGGNAASAFLIGGFGQDDNYSSTISPQNRIGGLTLAVSSGGGGSSASSAATVNAQQRYINASAPYDLGDGEVKLFIFVYLQDGEIMATYIADAPPWAYNGKTNIAPDCMVKDTDTNEIKPYKCKKINEPAAPWDGGDLAEWEAYQANPEYQLIEVTTEYKNADMQDIPHPFTPCRKFDDSGLEIEAVNEYILIDTCSPIIETLAVMHKNGENIAELLRDNKLIIGQEIPERKKPEGVIVRSIEWSS